MKRYWQHNPTTGPKGLFIVATMTGHSRVHPMLTYDIETSITTDSVKIKSMTRCVLTTLTSKMGVVSSTTLPPASVATKTAVAYPRFLPSTVKLTRQIEDEEEEFRSRVWDRTATEATDESEVLASTKEVQNDDELVRKITDFDCPSGTPVAELGSK